MKRSALRAVVVLGISGALITGCTDSDGGERSSGRSTERTSAEEAARASRAKIAEEVKRAVEGRLSVDELKYGSGTNSPCSTSSAQMFGAKCQAAADATSAAADAALNAINGRRGFATLDGVAHKLKDAIRSYDELGCAKGPTAVKTRTACLKPAAVIAQGFSDLRDGANMGLSGQ
ncbi:hypothetical protein AB0G74_14670 [Streptomyces sp. NPDC020875]|uniref:hypothetical protein n=1 Tax=Streptomyces sp. NPDC020875 TaxID=3154898 RepID=UPI00340D9E7B